MSITEFSQEMTAAAANFNDNLPCDIKSENTQQTTAMLTTQNALTWEMVPNIIKIKHEHELPTARKLHDEMVGKFAKLEIDVKRLRNESKDLKSKLEKKTKDLEIAEQDAIIWKMCCNNSQFNEIVEPRELHDQIMAHIRAEQKEIISQYKKKIKDMVQKRRENERARYADLKRSLWMQREIMRSNAANDELHMQIKDHISDGLPLFKKVDTKFTPKLNIERLRDDNKDLKSKLKKKTKDLKIAERKPMIFKTRYDLQLQRKMLAEKDRDSKNKITLVKALRGLENLGENERARHATSLAEAELACIRDEMTDSLKSEQIEYNRTHISTIYNRQTHL
ncbi:lamin-C-like isoform X1 [Formica exsecta]|uniref:lamin-C-like isoform X1 n=1 Tax=Formica exsecta TaxID=72781 RepID=UPI001141F46A|nr:lamin-C-like isoform X1 [Formica exsecta]